MPNPATVNDVEVRFRDLSSREQINAEALLDDAWELVTSRMPALEANMALGKVRSANVVRVLCAMVIRVLRNPEGKRQEAIDDYSYTRADVVADGTLAVTEAELLELTPTSSAVGTRTGSVRLVIYGAP